MWLSYNIFLDTFSYDWQVLVVLDSMTWVMQKFRLLRLRSWNVSILRNVHLQIQDAENRLLEAQQRISNEGFRAFIP